MIITSIKFDVGLAIPGRQVVKDIEPAHPSWDGWSFRVEGAHLVITSPPGASETLPEAIRAECEANGIPPKEAVQVWMEPLSRVRLGLLNADPGSVVGPSRAMCKRREAVAVERERLNKAVVENQAAAPAVERKKPGRPPGGKGPKPLMRPPGFTGNPVPPPSPPEEDAE